jgi:5'-nucleotidase
LTPDCGYETNNDFSVDSGSIKNEEKMHILVTNDDGVHAQGLLALVQAMRAIGKVSVLAPDHNWSAAGHVKTLNRPLRVNEVQLADGTNAMACDGAPSDCVALALLGFLPEVDLVVSGINLGANVGTDLTYSGTVTAVMESVIFGVPGIAFSVDGTLGYNPIDYRITASICKHIVQVAVTHGIPERVLLNVNIPYLPIDQINGFQITHLGKRVYRDALVSRVDPMGRPYYWIGGEMPTGIPEDGTDIGALAQKSVSITPVHLDLTAYQYINAIRNWDWPELSGQNEA